MNNFAKMKLDSNGFSKLKNIDKKHKTKRCYC